MPDRDVAPHLYDLVEAAIAKDEPRFHLILGDLTTGLIRGGMQAEAVWGWAEKVSTILGVPFLRHPLQ
jgi:hypothetical protein